MKLLAGMLATISAFAQTPTSKGVNFYSVEREIAMGKAETARLEAEVSVVHNATVDAYLERLGRELRPADAVFEYRLLTYIGPRLEGADEIVAIPGGTTFIPLQSMAEAASDTSIAAKMAHAIAHIELRHGTRQDTRMQIVRSAATPAIFMSGQSVTEIGANATTRQFEKDAEKAAAVYMSGRQENTASFDAARNAARAALER